jgi:hypothetical protein
METPTNPSRNTLDENMTIPTPPASSIASTYEPNPLPRHRKHPLNPGGPKESELIRYLDQSVGRVQLRVQNRANIRKSPVIGDDGKGYRTFAEAAKELEGLADVIWVSGSRKSLVVFSL